MEFEEFQEKKKMDRIVFSLPVLIIIVFLAAVSLVGAIKLYRTESSLKNDLIKLNQKLSATKIETAQIQQKIESLKTPEGVEYEARSRFNLKKSGEEVAIFVNDDKNNENIVSPSVPEAIWSVIKKFFGY